MMTVTLHDIRLAAEAISDGIERTPCVHSATLSAITGAEVYIKLENLQFTASFKDRGALFKLLSLTPEQRKEGVIAMSAGNHAQAVARHCQRLNIPAVIVMPTFTPNVKVEHTRAFGAEVILHGDSFDDAGTLASQLAAERRLTLIHPYDDERVIAGQGTIALEILVSRPDIEMLVVPVGGGGLISGNAIAAKSLNPDITVIGVETERFPAMYRALHGEPAEFGTGTLAEGIAVKSPGRLTLPLIREWVDDLLLVGESEIEEAVLLLLEVEKTLAEGAGAAGLAALLKYPERFAGRKVALILSGGNIDLPVLSCIIRRGLVRSGRLARIRMELRDTPGSLARAIASIESTGAQVTEVHHHRTFCDLPLQAVAVEFTLQTRGDGHLQEIHRLLERDGFKAGSPET